MRPAGSLQANTLRCGLELPLQTECPSPERRGPPTAEQRFAGFGVAAKWSGSALAIRSAALFGLNRLAPELADLLHCGYEPRPKDQSADSNRPSMSFATPVLVGQKYWA